MNAKKMKSTEQSGKPDIFSYEDYVVFLTDWFEYKRASQTKFSLRSLAKQAGLASGYLPMILSRTRPLSAAALAKMVPFLGLNTNEQSFLELLLTLRTADSHEARLVAIDRMSRFGQFRNQSERESEIYQYLTHWYYVAIRELASTKDFQAVPEWIQERLRFQVPLKDIKDTLDFLFEKKFLERRPDGTVVQTERDIDCRFSVFKVVMAQFHREALRLAAESIEKIPSAERQIVGHCFSLSGSDFQKAKAIADKAINEIRSLESKNDSADSVYHFEMALFPLISHKRSST